MWLGYEKPHSIHQTPEAFSEFVIQLPSFNVCLLNFRIMLLIQQFASLWCMELGWACLQSQPLKPQSQNSHSVSDLFQLLHDLPFYHQKFVILESRVYFLLFRLRATECLLVVWCEWAEIYELMCRRE